MYIKIGNPELPDEDCSSKFDETKSLIIEVDFLNNMFILRQEGKVTVLGELTMHDVISFYSR